MDNKSLFSPVDFYRGRDIFYGPPNTWDVDRWAVKPILLKDMVQEHRIVGISKAH